MNHPLALNTFTLLRRLAWHSTVPLLALSLSVATLSACTPTKAKAHAKKESGFALAALEGTSMAPDAVGAPSVDPLTTGPSDPNSPTAKAVAQATQTALTTTSAGDAAAKTPDDAAKLAAEVSKQPAAAPADSSAWFKDELLRLANSASDPFSIALPQKAEIPQYELNTLKPFYKMLIQKNDSIKVNTTAAVSPIDLGTTSADAALPGGAGAGSVADEGNLPPVEATVEQPLDNVTLLGISFNAKNPMVLLNTGGSGDEKHLEYAFKGQTVQVSGQAFKITKVTGTSAELTLLGPVAKGVNKTKTLVLPDIVGYRSAKDSSGDKGEGTSSSKEDATAEVLKGLGALGATPAAGTGKTGAASATGGSTAGKSTKKGASSASGVSPDQVDKLIKSLMES